MKISIILLLIILYINILYIDNLNIDMTIDSQNHIGFTKKIAMFSSLDAPFSGPPGNGASFINSKSIKVKNIIF